MRFVNWLFSFLELPIFTSKLPTQVIIDRGSTLSLCCKATGSPLPTIEWSRAQRFADVPLGFQQNGCIEVNTVRKNSDGDYICRARNSFGLAETVTAVFVDKKGCVF